MNNPVRGADRALMLFEAFEDLKRQLSLREIAAHCDLPVSSCHALVQTLLQRGYLYTLGKRKELYPNRKIFGMAQTIVANDPFISRFAADLEMLRTDCQETVTVAKLQGDVLQYIYTLDCPQPIRYAAKTGDFRPLHSTANGKALLSVMSAERLEEWLKANPLTAMTTKTITNRQRLLRDVAAGKSRGFFIAEGEYANDLDAVGVPVEIHNDVISVAIAGPAHRMQPARERLATRLLALKKRLEGGLARHGASETIAPVRGRAKSPVVA